MARYRLLLLFLLLVAVSFTANAQIAQPVTDADKATAKALAAKRKLALQMAHRVDEAVVEMKTSRISADDYAGGFKLNQAAGGMNYYFTCIGLLPFAGDPDWERDIAGFLDLYLRQANPEYGWIDDINNLQSTPTLTLSDSDDSYAALLLLLSSEFYKTDAGKVWWKKNNNANREKIKFIARKILLENQKTSDRNQTSKMPLGLISVYSKQRHFENRSKYPDAFLHRNGASDEATRNFCIKVEDASYLMDASECYTGLSALAATLKKEGDPENAKFAVAARLIPAGMMALFDKRKHAFYVLTLHKKNPPVFYSGSENRFYSTRIAQVWPELFHVPLIENDPAGTKTVYDGAWRYFNAGHDDWMNAFPKDGSTGGFPWMALAEAARRRAVREKSYQGMAKEMDMALDHLIWFEKVLAEGMSDEGNQKTSVNYNFRYIHEVGWAYRVKKWLMDNPNYFPESKEN